MIIKEWKCLDCSSFFESSDADPVCPQCSAAEPERAFLTAPGFKSPQTLGKDRDLKQLAADHGLSNMSNRDGEPVMSRRGQQGPQQAHAKWGGDMQNVLSRLGPDAQGISDGRGFAPPRPQVVASTK